MIPPPEEYTEDHLLNGRVALRQARQGFRAGLDAVLLAAFVPARPGDSVLEAGAGSGAAFLCLAARVPGLAIRAVEREAAMAALARDNAARAGLVARIELGDVADLALARALGPVAHGFANPPYWPGGTPPPGAIRRAATHEAGTALSDWVGFLAAAIAPRGSLSLILPAARFDAAVVAMRQAGFGALELLPLWPRAGVPAKRALLRAWKGARGPAKLYAGLVLHEADGRFTEAAEATLRDAAAL
ncbi:MAG: N-6 DNA methylase [Roseomonas sp.]|nr:N-6 DNA methylase [Roseomonas sp.]MCA3326200.1 N-6 DNA methylase [Roseomonas sp.]MCA3330306.1 N-6 DNA methylase [Roseomonas sp.]MCA3335244.1 N-6 DNA methylase [Roseomonas sp.]MCA3355392.1 N-6 DNA methylase [Roseomonas sp.]